MVVTTFDDDELALRALRAGARGYLLEDVTLDQLVGAIHTNVLLELGVRDRTRALLRALDLGLLDNS